MYNLLNLRCEPVCSYKYNMDKESFKMHVPPVLPLMTAVYQHDDVGVKGIPALEA